MVLTPDQELDLRWFFTEARGECGLKSAQGGIEFGLNASKTDEEAAAQHRLERRQREAEEGFACQDIHVKAGRFYACINFTEDRLIELCEKRPGRDPAPSRASAVARRLRMIHPSHAATLEAQFCQQEIPGAGVSPLLVVRQSVAVDTYRDVLVRHAKRKRKTATPTPLMWLHALINTASQHPTGDEARALGTILSQARTALAVASEAYTQVR